jgi:hypothetical protein
VLSTSYRELAQSPWLWRNVCFEQAWSPEEIEGVARFASPHLRVADVQTRKVTHLRLLLRSLRDAPSLTELHFPFPGRLVQLASPEDHLPLAALLQGVAADAERAALVAAALQALYMTEQPSDLDLQLAEEHEMLRHYRQEMKDVKERQYQRDTEKSQRRLVMATALLGVLRRHTASLVCARSCLEALSADGLRPPLSVTWASVPEHVETVCDAMEAHPESRRVLSASIKLLMDHVFPTCREKRSAIVGVMPHPILRPGPRYAKPDFLSRT